MPVLSPEVVEASKRSVLCWLATVAPDGSPNVSPKEIFAVHDGDHVVVANIASPGTVRNLAHSSKVCLSFVDVFVQKGYKVTGTARNVGAKDEDFPTWAEPLLAMAGPRFPIRSVIVIRALGVEPILAPSYRLYPAETTEQSQAAAAMRTYGVTNSTRDA